MGISPIPRRLRPRVTLVAAAALAVTGGLLAAGLQSSPARAAATATAASQWTGGTRPVIVLEHGAWADASSWDGVITDLQRAGFTVYAPPDPLRGLSSDAAYLHDFLTENPALQGRPVVLVGHSYGGAVITNAAVGDPEVKALVYVDAFIPGKGQTVAGLLGKVPGSCIGNPAASSSLSPTPARQPTVPTCTCRPRGSLAASRAACLLLRQLSSPPRSDRSPQPPSCSRPDRLPGRRSRPGPLSAPRTRSSPRPSCLPWRATRART